MTIQNEREIEKNLRLQGGECELGLKSRICTLKFHLGCHFKARIWIGRYVGINSNLLVKK